MTSDERVQAIADYGLTERQARFLVLVMRHSGLCIKRQYAAFAGIKPGGEKCHAFFDKVWVARWREDVLCEDGKVGRILRSVVLGSVADLPTRKDAQVRLDEELRGVNQGTVRPESSMLFGTFAEEQWKTLVLPTLKLSTQHGYKTVLAKHLLPYWRDSRLRDIGRQDVQQWVADRCSSPPRTLRSSSSNSTNRTGKAHRGHGDENWRTARGSLEVSRSRDRHAVGA